jgi:hypothetical protein
MPRTLRAGQRAQLFVIDVTSGERRLLYESRTQLFEAPNWTSVQDSRHGAKVVGWSGPGFDFVAQDEVGAPSLCGDRLRWGVSGVQRLSPGPVRLSSQWVACPADVHSADAAPERFGLRAERAR